MRPPPVKKKGQARGRRAIAGKLLLGIPETAALLGLSEKSVRGRIERGQLPHRKLGGRIVVLRLELETFLAAQPGVGVEQTLANCGIELPR